MFSKFSVWSLLVPFQLYISVALLVGSKFLPVRYKYELQNGPNMHQKIPQSHTADQPTAPWGRATEQQQSQNTKEMITKLERTQSNAQQNMEETQNPTNMGATMVAHFWMVNKNINMPRTQQIKQLALSCSVRWRVQSNTPHNQIRAPTPTPKNKK